MEEDFPTPKAPANDEEKNPFSMTDKEAQEKNNFFNKEKTYDPRRSPVLRQARKEAATPKPSVKAETFFKGRQSVPKWQILYFLGKRGYQKDFGGDIDKSRLKQMADKFFGDKEKNFYTRKDLEKIQRALSKEKVYKEGSDKRSEEKFLKGINEMLK